jgi:hypothetical protein
MPFYYTAATSGSTSASAATQIINHIIRTGTTKGASISRIGVGAKGTAQDNPCLFQAWRPTTANSAGTAITAVPHDSLSPAAVSIQASGSPTGGTKGATPVVQLAFNSRAYVQWVALNPDEALTLTANATATTGNMDFYSEEAAGVAVSLAYSITHFE